MHTHINSQTDQQKILDLKETTKKLFIAFNGPEIGEADQTLKSALDLHFSSRGGSWHFSTNQLLKTAGLTVTKKSIKLCPTFGVYCLVFKTMSCLQDNDLSSRQCLVFKKMSCLQDNFVSFALHKLCFGLRPAQLLCSRAG